MFIKTIRNVRSPIFVLYIVVVVVVLCVVSRNTLVESFNGKGYFYVYSLDDPAYLFTLIAPLLKIFKLPLVAEVTLYYFLLTLISAVSIYLMLSRLIEALRIRLGVGLKCLAVSLGGILYVLYPRELLTDVGPSFLMLKALLPLLLLFGITAVKATSRKALLSSILSSSSLLSLGYMITYDPRLIIHSLIIMMIFILSLSYALSPKACNAIRKTLKILAMITLLAFAFSLPRLYADLFVRTMPIGSGIAFVKNAFLYTWSTYLTSFMSVPAFLYPFYKLKLGSLASLLLIPAFISGIMLVSVFMTKKKLHSKIAFRFVVINFVFFIIFLAVFASSQFFREPLIVNIAFSKLSIHLYHDFPMIRYVFILLRAPRLLDDFLHIFYTIIATLLSATVFTSTRKNFIRIPALLLLLLIVVSLVGLWVAPSKGNALIFNIKAIKEAKYYDEFLESVHGDVLTSLNTMLWHGARPGGYLIKYIYPVRPYWRADGTIANFIYEFLREKIYTGDLFSAYLVLNLYGFKYLIVNTINGPDKAVNILNESKYFKFIERIGSFYVFKVKNTCDYLNDIVLLRKYVFVVGGLETYIKFLKLLNVSRINIMDRSTHCVLIAPVFDDSWSYNITYAIKNSLAIVLMNKKDIYDLLLSYIVLQKKYDSMILPSEYVYVFNPKSTWSPAFSSYAFHGIFPYFNWFPAPYTWEYGYNPRYGFIWTFAKNAKIAITFNVPEYGKYIILVRHLITPKPAKIAIKIDNKTYILQTQDPTSTYSYLKVSPIGPIILNKGKHTMEIVNLEGFNMINMIIIIGEKKLHKYINELNSLLAGKIILHIPLYNLANLTSNGKYVELIQRVHELKRNLILSGYYCKCAIRGIFYRRYLCSIFGEKEAKSFVLILPELYGIIRASNVKAVSIPIMYVLQGYSNLKANNTLLLNDVRYHLAMFRWVAFILSSIILLATLISRKELV